MNILQKIAFWLMVACLIAMLVCMLFFVTPAGVLRAMGWIVLASLAVLVITEILKRMRK